MTDEVKQAAAEGGDPFFADAVIEGTHVLQLVVPVGDGYALQLVRPLEEVDRLLDRIGIVLILVSLGGIAAAAAFGALVARTALRPVTQLTREAEVVAETRDLSHRIGLEGNDELARLGASFDTMLAALDESQQQQRQLVADASHELGTPLTSIRTNVEVLARRNDLAPEAREALLGDLVGQLGEMSGLVTGLVELASEAPTELERGRRAARRARRGRGRAGRPARAPDHVHERARAHRGPRRPRPARARRLQRARQRRQVERAGSDRGGRRGGTAR